MKKNIFMMVAAMLLTITTNVNAQNTDSCAITDEQLALAASTFTNGECFESSVKDGELNVDLHGGWYAEMDGVFTSHHLTNNDGVGGTGDVTTWGAEIGIGYRLVRKGWPIAIRPEVRTGYQTSFNSEGLKTGAHNNALAGVFVENSHGALRVAVGATYEHERLTSRRTLGLENGTLDVPYAAKAQYLGGAIQLSTTVAKINRHKVANVGGAKIPVRGQYHVDLFAEGNLSFATVNKFWTSDEAKTLGFEPELKDRKISVKVGLRFYWR